MRISSATAFAALILAASAAPAGDVPTHKSSKGGVVHLSGSRVSERSPLDWGDVAKPFEKVGTFLTGGSKKEETTESSNEKRAPVDWDDVAKPFEKVGDAITGNDKNEKRSPITWDEFKKPFETAGNWVTGNSDKNEKRDVDSLIKGSPIYDTDVEDIVEGDD